MFENIFGHWLILSCIQLSIIDLMLHWMQVIDNILVWYQISVLGLGIDFTFQLTKKNRLISIVSNPIKVIVVFVFVDVVVAGYFC